MLISKNNEGDLVIDGRGAMVFQSHQENAAIEADIEEHFIIRNWHFVNSQKRFRLFRFLDMAKHLWRFSARS